MEPFEVMNLIRPFRWYDYYWIFFERIGNGISWILIFVLCTIVYIVFLKDRIKIDFDQIVKLFTLKQWIQIYLVIVASHVAVGLVTAPIGKLHIRNTSYTVEVPEEVRENTYILSNTPYAENGSTVELYIYGFKDQWLKADEVEALIEERTENPLSEIRWVETIVDESERTEEYAEPYSYDRSKEIDEYDMRDLNAYGAYFKLLNKYKEALDKLKK